MTTTLAIRHDLHEMETRLQSRFDGRFAQVNARFLQIDSRFESLERHMDTRFV